jgi:predicted Fe-Mo cluster-binding NifX family protein
MLQKKGIKWITVPKGIIVEVLKAIKRRFPKSYANSSNSTERKRERERERERERKRKRE